MIHRVGELNELNEGGDLRFEILCEEKPFIGPAAWDFVKQFDEWPITADDEKVTCPQCKKVS